MSTPKSKLNPLCAAACIGLLGMHFPGAAVILSKDYIFDGGMVNSFPPSLFDNSSSIIGIVTPWSVSLLSTLEPVFYYYHDYEIYLSQLPDLALPSIVASGPFPDPATTPYQLRFATQGFDFSSSNGIRQNTELQFSFDFGSGQTGSNNSLYLKSIIAGPIDTRPSNGLFLHMDTWTGVPGMMLTVISNRVTLFYSLTDYQIFDNGLPSSTIDPGDNAFNAANYDNRQLLVSYDARLSNLPSGILTNSGQMTLDSELLNQGIFDNRGNFSGRIINSSGPISLGQIFNTGSLTMVTGRDYNDRTNSINEGSIKNINDGLITVEHGATLVNLNSIAGYDRSSLRNDGTVLNSGSIFLHDQSIFHNFGTVQNAGTLYLQDTAVLINHADLINQFNGYISVGGSAIFINQGGSIKNFGQIELNGALLRNFDGGRLIVMPTGSVTGGQFIQQSGASTTVAGTMNLGIMRIDGGDVEIDASGKVNSRFGVIFDSPGGTLTVNGTLSTTGGGLAAVQVVNGTLKGSGLIQGAGLQMGDIGLHSPSNAFLRPGNSPGTLTIEGTLVMGAGAELDLEIALDGAGHLVWDHVVASHMSFLAGSTVRFSVGAGVSNLNPGTLDFLSCGSGCDFASGVNWAVDGAPGASFSFSSTGLQLKLPMTAAVPEPETWALMAGGLLALGYLARRRGGLSGSRARG